MTTSEDIIIKAEELFKQGVRKFKVTFSDYTEVRRVGMSRNGLMLMKPRSKKYGCLLSYMDVLNVEPIHENVDVTTKHRKQLLKAINLLKESNLWKDTLKEMELALSIGYDTLKKAYDITNQKFSEDYYENQKIIVQKIKELEPRLINTNDGVESYNTKVLWYLVNPLKVKRMNFGNNNEAELEQIQKALNTKTRYTTTGRTSYDVSFEYNPTVDRAWYSEEFKGCGNGHYYLALNHEYAVFYEDD